MIIGRTRVVVFVAAAAAFLVMFVASLVQGDRFGADEVVHDWVIGHRVGWLTGPARLTSEAGSSPVLYAFLAAGAMAAAIRGPRLPRVRAICLIAALLVAEMIVRTGLSIAVGRVRPRLADWLVDASGYSFPSGHTANATTAAGLLACVIALQSRPGWRRWIAYLGAAVFASAVGASRIYLGVHWPSDVLAAWALGICWVVSCQPLVARLAPLIPPDTG